MFDTSRPFTFDRVVRILITIATLIGAYWLLKAISGALLPFCVACLLAYIFEPFVAFNKRLLRCRGNVLPIFLFLVELFGVIALLGWFLIPRIIDEIVTVGNLFNDYATSSSSRYIPQAVHDFVMKYVDMKTLASVLTQEQWSDIVQKIAVGHMDHGQRKHLNAADSVQLVYRAAILHLHPARLRPLHEQHAQPDSAKNTNRRC